MLFRSSNFGIRLYGSSALIVLAYIILVLPHGTRLIMSGIAQINPQLEAAARVFGSTLPGAVIRILVPLLRRNMASAAMLMFILLSHEFAASSLLFGPNTQVLSTLLYGQWDTGTYPRVAALALVMVAIALAGFIALVASSARAPATKTEAESAKASAGSVRNLVMGRTPWVMARGCGPVGGDDIGVAVAAGRIHHAQIGRAHV